MFEWLKTICELIEFFGEAADWKRIKAEDGHFLYRTVVPKIKKADMPGEYRTVETEVVKLELYGHPQHGYVYVGLARKAKELWYRAA